MSVKDKLQSLKESVNDSVETTNKTIQQRSISRDYNKMFGPMPSNSTNILSDNPNGSWFKRDRLNILDGTTAFEFNTYKNWAPFSILMEPGNFDSKHDYEYVDNKGVKINEVIYDSTSQKAGIVGRKSLFNPFTAVNETNAVRLSVNAPLLDDTETNIQRFQQNDCSIKSLIEATQSGRLGVATYSYADFMYCKYLGKCSNEYLITLRRFAYPPGDHINTVGYEVEKETQNHTNDIGRMVTWMGTPGNDMANILKYSVKIPYKKFTAQIEEVDEQNTTSNGILASIMNLGDARNRQLIESGMGGGSSTQLLASALSLAGAKGKRLAGMLGDPPYTGAKWRTNYDRNKSYGPLDVITETYQRQAANDGGLEFSQTISLQFDYELRSYDGINGRAAMMDLIANILATCYTTGKFWGGATKFLGASQSNTYSNLPIFMTNASGQKPGNMAQYTKNIADSFNMVFGGDATREERLNAQKETITSQKKKTPKSTGEDGSGPNVIKKVTSLFGDIGSMIQNAGSALGSLLYGGLINKLGRPQVLAVNSLLSDAPTGLWHLTIGNPKAPIMSMGNMIIDKCEIEHKGPLGIDGFPTGLSVKIDLIHGKPRENTAIERMYMQGDYRIYSPMGDQVLKMYWGAPSLALMTASQARSKQLNNKVITEADYRKSRFYVEDFVNDFKKVSPADATPESIHLARYFGTVASISLKGTSPDTYLQNEGMEALFGSTSTDDAKASDGRDEVLENRYKALKDVAENNTAIAEAKASTKESREKINEQQAATKDYELTSGKFIDDNVIRHKATNEGVVVQFNKSMAIDPTLELTGDYTGWLASFDEWLKKCNLTIDSAGAKEARDRIAAIVTEKANIDNQTNEIKKRKQSNEAITSAQ